MADINGRPIPEDKELVFPNISTIDQRKDHYTKEVMKHPAKMPTYLARWIIKKFSEEGESVLDPMAGIGTTVIESSLLGRHGIGVEYEKKFVEIILRNIKKSLKTVKAQSFLSEIKRGKMTVIHGDSRYLSLFLSKRFRMVPIPEHLSGETVPIKEWKIFDAETKNIVETSGLENKHNLTIVNKDLIMMSPPYAEALGFFRGQGTLTELYETGKIVKNGITLHRGNVAPYSKDPENIGNLRYDLICSSPPYAKMIHGQSGDRMKEKVLAGEYKGLRPDVWVSDTNIGSQGFGRGYSKDPVNIGNLKYDLIAYSPPFGGGMLRQRENRDSYLKIIADRIKRKHKDHPRLNALLKQIESGEIPSGFQSRGTEDPENIGNLKYDLICTSPPFFATHSGQKPSGIAIDPEAHGHKGIAIPDYTDEKDNIDRIKVYGTPYPNGDIYDLIVSSPPYSEIRARGGQEKGALKYKTQKAISTLFHAYNKNINDKIQIGNLKHGDYDLLTFSPPYGEGLGHAQKNYSRDTVAVGLNWKYMQQFRENNIASLPHGYIDAVVFSPPYGHQSYTEKDHKKTQWREDHDFNIGHEKSDWYGDTLGNIGLIPHNPMVDNVFFSPPYGHGGSVYSKMNPDVVENNPNMKGRKAFAEDAAEPYSANTNNIGVQKGETYLEAMYKVYSECYSVLKENGYMVLVTKNFVKDKEEVRLDLDTIKLCERAGFTLTDHYYHKLNNLSFWQVLHRKRCANLRLTTKSKLLKEGYKIIPYIFDEEKDSIDLDKWNDRDQVPICKFSENCRGCPFPIGNEKTEGKVQGDCDHYFTKYPKIEHEDVLVFQKAKKVPIDVI